MSEEQDRRVNVKVFDRYARQTILSGNNQELLDDNQHQDKTDHFPTDHASSLYASSLNYKDELRTHPMIKIRSVQESLREGIIVIAESDQLNDHLSAVTELDDSIYESETLLDETEDVITHDLFDIVQWEVWISTHASASQKTQESSSLLNVRTERAKKWNDVLSSSLHFQSLDQSEYLNELKIDLFSVDTLSLVDKEDPLSLDMNENHNGEENHTFTYRLSKRAIELSPLSLIRLSDLAVKQHISETSHYDSTTQVADRGESKKSTTTVRTVPHHFVDQVISKMRPLFKLVESLQNKNMCLGGFDPSLFGQHPEDSNTVRPLYPLPLFSTESTAHFPKVSGEERRLYTGFSPPEMYGYFGAKPSKASDVFSAGMMLYYALTNCPRFSETRRPFFRLPSPFVYRQDLIPELVAVICRAVSPDPSRRQKDMSTFLTDIEWALESALERESEHRPVLNLEAGQEIHIGLLKGQYNPINQDDLFLGYQVELDLGLFVVTDGVSICEYGSGDLASGFVREAAVESWRDLCQVQTLTEDEDTLSEVSLGMIEGLSGNYGKFLKQLVNDSNRRIGQYVNQKMPVFHGPPEGIMAATIVAAVFNQGVATLTSVGDSRIYLIRNGYIVSLMYDEDLYTHLLQAQQSPTQAQQSPSSSALVHCIGEFTKSTEQQLIPSTINPQLRELKLLPGDYLLLCSDGLPDYSGTDEADAEERMRECVENSFNVHHAAFELIALANRGGGGDNLSCIVLKFVADQVSLEEDQP